jgi:hypothetical protein
MPTDTVITAPVQKSQFTVTTFYDRVRGDCALRGSNRVTDVDILAWLNEAQDEIAIETHWYRTSKYLTQTINVKEYDLPVSPRCITIEEIWIDDIQRQLIHMSTQDISGMSFYAPTWRYNSAGTPIYYYLQTNSAFGLHPTPDTTTSNNIFVVYTAIPARATASGDYLYHPAGHEKTIIAYACWKASLKDAIGEGEKRMNIFRAAYVEGIKKCKAEIEGLGQEAMTVVGEYGSTMNGRGLIRPDWYDGTPIPAPG